MRVLVIDDAPEIRRIAIFSLTRFGKMQVLEAASGQEGVEAARAHRPDAILLDMVLPDIDGGQVLAALRADPLTAAIPVVLLTASTLDPERVRAMGARAALAKPFQPLELPDALRAALGEP
jgi:CheY-like chemotaxis protein